MKRVMIGSLAPLVLLALAGCHMAIERDIHVESGRTVGGSINVIDGDIIIGSDCVLRSSCRTVDGDIEVGRGSRVDNLQCVDGNIRVGRDVEVRRDVELVDGTILCRSGTVVGGNINAIDGAQYYQIRLTFISNPLTGLRPEVSALAVSWRD